MYQQVPVLEVERIDLGEEIDLGGPSTLAFDGDREHQIQAGTATRAVVRRDGPRVVDVRRTLEVGASKGFFVLP